MLLNLADILLLIHPILACTFIFPVIGIVGYLAWQTRQRRLSAPGEAKGKISPQVGREHVAIGNLLAAGVVGITLVALAYGVVFGYQGFLDQAKDGKLRTVQVGFVVVMFILTLVSLGILMRTRAKLWRGVFATLTGLGIGVLGWQPGIFHRNDEWYISHYYFGIVASWLMIFAAAIVQDIYQSKKWRRVHIILNSLALILFILQGVTGTRDLLELPLSWQESVVYSCNFDSKSPEFKTCPK
ncbi:DUF4079 domain-containing protein [Synechococcus sp. PCC 6312]|uniref:DUF4079 domain-containing protein n=1 Tax=Synechococcus sp. (strain ATCC 27167 / PCC 6312) TaxID=195253 RepID=UPI00029EF48B|nr:DUF4079 domain-containing protein [Synechococcus sp. PCC 6312]AFY60995.1 hypothetical protein Syn6312_1851 [Synechococcus sp. PCC 6312]